MKIPRVSGDRRLIDGHIFEVIERTLDFPNGRIVKRTMVAHPGAVVIVPQTARGTYLLTKQYRAALDRVILEFPAGTLERGEQPLACAKRELVEEVGHSAAEWLELGQLFPAPGFCSETQWCYLARDLSAADQDLDEDEILEVVELSLSKIEDEIRGGGIMDAKTIALYGKLICLGLAH